MTGYTGIELWNGMSEFKSLLKSKFHAIYYAFNPNRVATGPFPKPLGKWDELLSAGKRIVAVGGSDAHAFLSSMGPLRRIIFPYEFHFRAVNTHLLIKSPLSGELDLDRKLIYEALPAAGHSLATTCLPPPAASASPHREKTAWPRWAKKSPGSKASLSRFAFPGQPNAV